MSVEWRTVAREPPPPTADSLPLIHAGSRVGIVTGAGKKAFSAGMDLKGMPAQPTPLLAGDSMLI